MVRFSANNIPLEIVACAVIVTVLENGHRLRKCTSQHSVITVVRVKNSLYIMQRSKILTKIWVFCVCNKTTSDEVLHLVICGMWSAPSLLSLLVSPWPAVLALIRSLSRLIYLISLKYSHSIGSWETMTRKNREIGPAVRVFANGPGDLGSIPGRVIPKTLKMELDTTLLNTQHYKVRFKGKVEQSREWSSALPYTLV